MQISQFSRRLFAAIALFGLIAFLVWIIFVILPVVFVEIKYQFRSTFAAIGLDNPRTFFLPDPSGMTIIGNGSKNKDYGIFVPKISLDEKVIFNVDPNDEEQYRAALKQGIAHASSTSYPDSNGLGYYFAHSSNPSFHLQYNAVFYLLDKLESGDEVYIWKERKRYRYLVSEKMIKESNDIAFLYQQYDGEMIVLQTCWPPGTTQKRLLVFAKRAN